METINCCIVSYGGIAEFHAEALTKIEGARIHWIVGRREEPSEAFARKHGAANWSTDLKTALADPDLDAVVVASPSERHVEQSLAALAEGKHVIVEILVAISHKGARDVAGAARKSGLKVQVAHTRRFDEVGRFVSDFARSGKPGDIYQHHSYSYWFRHKMSDGRNIKGAGWTTSCSTTAVTS